METNDKTTEYEYDKVGNRMQMKIFNTEDTEVTEYFYNSDNQLLSYAVNETDTVYFIYDANGNQIIKATTNDTHYYNYDYDNNLLCVSAANDTNIISYIYSPDGKRLKRYLNDIGTKYFYDADDVLTEYDTNTVVVCRYTNNLGIDDIISSKRNSISEWYHKDALGSVTDLTLSNENVSVSYRYDAFGSIESQTNSHQNEYTYTGRQIDREAGLYYYRSRYYNSAVGRFIRKDDYLGSDNIIISLNYYIYGDNSPLTFYDPLGFASCSIITTEHEITTITKYRWDTNKKDLSSAKWDETKDIKKDKNTTDNCKDVKCGECEELEWGSTTSTTNNHTATHNWSSSGKKKILFKTIYFETTINMTDKMKIITEIKDYTCKKK